MLKSGVPVAHNYPYLLPEGSPEVRQIAMDGVQFSPENYTCQPFLNNPDCSPAADDITGTAMPIPRLLREMVDAPVETRQTAPEPIEQGEREPGPALPPDLAVLSVAEMYAADAAAAVRFGAAQTGIDADRIGLFGSSQGGWTAPLVLMLVLACLQAWVGYLAGRPATIDDNAA